MAPLSPLFISLPQQRRSLAQPGPLRPLSAVLEDKQEAAVILRRAFSLPRTRHKKLSLEKIDAIPLESFGKDPYLVNKEIPIINPMYNNNTRSPFQKTGAFLHGKNNEQIELIEQFSRSLVELKNEEDHLIPKHNSHASPQSELSSKKTTDIPLNVEEEEEFMNVGIKPKIGNNNNSGTSLLLQYNNAVEDEDFLNRDTNVEKGSIAWFRRHRYTTAVLVSFVIFVDMVFYTIFLPIQYSIKIDGFQLTKIKGGLLIAIYACGLFLATPFFGILSDTSGQRKIPILISLGSLAALSMVLYFLYETYIGLAFVRFLQGVSAAGNWTIGLAIANDCFPPEQLGSVMGFVLAAMNLGYIVGPLIGGAIYQHGNMFLVCIFICLLSLTAFSLTLFVVPQHHKFKLKSCKKEKKIKQSNIKLDYDLNKSVCTISEEDSRKIIFKKKLTSRGLEIIISSLKAYSLITERPVYINAICISAVGCSVAALEATLPLLLKNLLKIDKESEVGAFFLCISVPGVLLTPVAGYLCGKFDLRHIMAVSIALISLSVFLLFIPSSTLSLIGSLCFFGVAYSFALTPPLPEMGIYVQEFYPDSGGRVYSLFSMAFSVSLIIGPLLGGVLYDTDEGFKYISITFALIYILLLVVYICYLKKPNWVLTIK